MQNSHSDLKMTGAGDSVDLRTEARSLRRKVVFWRRAAFFLLGSVALFLVVAWQRTTVRRRECQQAITHFAEEARISKLDQVAVELLESQWEHLAKGPVKLEASHYEVFVQNWLQTPASGKSLPLAICRSSHPGILARGRHLLSRDERGMHIEWLAEEEAAPIAARTRRD